MSQYRQYNNGQTGAWNTLTDGTTTVRQVVRDGYLCTDKTLTALGFLGTESTDGGATGDWVNVKAIPISWSSYWTKQDFNQWAKGRSGMNMVDNYGNNIPILPAYFYEPVGAGYGYISDNGALDIYNTDFTVWAKIKSENHVISDYNCFIGKKCSSSLVGRYYIQFQTTGALACSIQTSVNNFSVVSAATTYGADDLWHTVRMDVNQSTGKLRFFIDNVQQGSDVSFTGTFPHLDNKFKFFLKGTNDLNGAVVTGQISKTSHSDCFLLRRLLTPTEATACESGTYPSDVLAYWPCAGGGEYIPDASGNGYHLTTANYVGGAGNGVYNVQCTRFGSAGSVHLLNNGYSLYTKGSQDIYVPNTLGGVENVVTLPLGYTKLGDNHPGNLTKHNLANSVLAMTNANFDRSNATIYSDAARNALTYYDATSATTKKYWHISECNNLKFQSWANVGYKGIVFFKVSDHSYKSRKTLDEVLSFITNKSGSNYSKIVSSYCQDYVYTDTYENDYIYWKYSTDNIVTIRGDKVLKFNSGTNTLSLSLDGGKTYGISKVITGVTEIQYAKIYLSGNISFGSQTAMYYSTDNLATYHTATVLDKNGNPFVASSTTNFSQWNRDKQWGLIGGIELEVWGNYTQVADGVYVNVNMFYTINEGQTIKAFWTADVTYDAYHIHGVTYNDIDDEWWFTTGDGLASHLLSDRVYKCKYNSGADTWTVTTMVEGTASSVCKIVGLGFNGTSVYSGTDAHLGYVDVAGMYQIPKATFGTTSTWVKIFQTPNYGPYTRIVHGFYKTGSRFIITTQSDMGILISEDLGVTYKGSIPYGIPITGANDSFHGYVGETSDGWGVLLHAYNNVPQYGGNSMWIKIK